MRAWIAAVEGRTAEALRLFHDALAAWQALDLVWDQAMTGIDAVTLLDPTGAEVIAMANSTRTILERLGASPYIARLDEVVGRTPRKPAATERSVEPGGVAAAAS
jgi:hypothetical protein